MSRKNKTHARNLTPTQRLQRYEQNGITVKDMARVSQESYDKGFTVGYNTAAENTFQMMIAAMCLALKKQYRFGRKRVLRVLHDVDRRVIYELNSEELIEQVWDELKIQLEFSGEFDRIKEEAE